MCSSAKSLNKVASLQKRALRFLYEDYALLHEELLQKAGKKTMKVNRLRSLCNEIYKSINNINPCTGMKFLSPEKQLERFVVTINSI